MVCTHLYLSLLPRAAYNFQLLICDEQFLATLEGCPERNGRARGARALRSGSRPPAQFAIGCGRSRRGLPRISLRAVFLTRLASALWRLSVSGGRPPHRS